MLSKVHFAIYNLSSVNAACLILMMSEWFWCWLWLPTMNSKGLELFGGTLVLEYVQWTIGFWTLSNSCGIYIESQSQAINIATDSKTALRLITKLATEMCSPNNGKQNDGFNKREAYSCGCKGQNKWKSTSTRCIRPVYNSERDAGGTGDV